MLASLHTSPTSDQAVKELLDQRARASHARYPSVSFSQSSDSPSIYSRGDVSPNPLYTPVEELPLRSGQPMAIIGPPVFHNSEERIRKPPSAVPRSPSDSDRYFTVYEDDVGNDEMSFVSATTPRPQVSRREAEFRHVSGSDFESSSLEQVEDDPRMSLLGPKMRFVSRAPWETGEDDLLEANEEEASGAIDGLSIFGGKLGGKKGREEKSFVKSPGLATFRSRSPGPPSGPVKKGGSMNFGLHRRKSPELPSESIHGPYLSSASQGHSAVNSFSSARSSDSVTDSQSSYNLGLRAPIPRVPSGPISPTSKASASPLPPSPNASPFRTPKPSFSSHDDSSLSSFRSESPPPPFRIVHPYANPDLVPVMDPPLSAPLPRISRMNQDHSNEGCDEFSPPLRRLSESSQAYPRLLSPQRGSPSDMPPTSQSLSADSEINERFCEGPDPTIDLMSHLPSQLEQKDGLMRNLISLEQARARAHNIPHLSAINVPAPRSIPTSTLVAGLGLPPGVVVENGVMRGQGQRSATIPFPRSDPLAAQNQDLQRRRPRTMSSGKHMGGSGVAQRLDGDTVPVKTLKHKKSAFMKLFHGGKDKDREKEQSKEPAFSAQPPAIRAVSTPPQTSSNDQSIPPLSGTVNPKRVPPPLLSVVVTSPSIGGSGLSAEAAQETIKRPTSPPRLRQTSSPSPLARGQVSSQNQLPLPPRATHLSPSSSSAPPSQAEFKALSLRPISTMFNAFPDLLSPSSPSHNSPTARNQNPSYPSPTTPGFETSCSNSMSTTSDYPITPTSVKPDYRVSDETPSPTEDQSVVVTMLQEQIINMRKAWQRQIWELEGQVKDLKIEVEELRNTGECETCGRVKRDGRLRTPAPQSHSVVDRPRPRMGGNTRSVFGGGNDT